MNENYLLHNETAKKLYFEYARKLPIMNFSSKLALSERPYNNITEAFLLNDESKLGAMRECGVDDKYICGDASDFEKFKCFCSILPEYAGNPIYLLSHIELRDIYGCEFDICEENCERIWELTNRKIFDGKLSEKKLFELADIESVSVLMLDWREELDVDKTIIDLQSFETALLDKVRKAHENGYRAALKLSYTDYIKPSAYEADQIIKKLRSDKKNTLDMYSDEYDLLDMQSQRILGKEYKRLGWVSFIQKGGLDSLAEEYLMKNDALPVTVEVCELYLNDIRNTLKTYAESAPLGRLICYLDFADDKVTHIPYAKYDYFRRALCNYIGKLVERGEYTDDEKNLKKLITDILYNNIKEVL